MKLPGTARLEFQMDPIDETTTRLTMTARFRPRGLAGILYWYSLVPTHRWLFEGMLRTIARKTGMAVHSGPEAAEVDPALECRL